MGMLRWLSSDAANWFLFKLRICILGSPGTGLGLMGVCWCMVVPQAIARFAAAGAEAGVGMSRKAAVVGQRISLHVSLLAVVYVCVCAWMMNLRMKIGCLNSLSCLMQRDEKLPTLYSPLLLLQYLLSWNNSNRISCHSYLFPKLCLWNSTSVLLFLEMQLMPFNFLAKVAFFPVIPNFHFFFFFEKQETKRCLSPPNKTTKLNILLWIPVLSKKLLLFLHEMFIFFIPKYRNNCFCFLKRHFFQVITLWFFPSHLSSITVKKCSMGFPSFLFPWVGRSVVSQISLLYLSPHFVFSFSTHH